jgi:GNAT superfamily N-acetyltransferase
MSTPEVRVFELKEYTDEMAAGIGTLMGQLDPGQFSSDPTPRDRLERIIRSPYHAQIVAVHETEGVVGALTLSLLLEPGFDQQAYVGGVATRTDLIGQGIGRKMVEGMFDWARANSVDELELMTERSKPTQPLGFWLRMGAELRDDSAVLTLKVPK